MLLLAWHFPPATNGGVYRPLSLVRHGASAGWQFTVVSEELSPKQSQQGQYLLERVPSAVRTLRYRDRRSRLSWDFLPQLDGGLANLTHSLTVLRRALLKGPRPSVILASGPPFFNFPLARLLSGWLGVPYVIEYRDEWTLCPHDFVQTGLLDRWAERWSLAGAAHVVFATQSKLEHCLQQYPVFDRARASVVPNGWDPSWKAVTAQRAAEPPEGGRLIRVAFAGTLANHADPGPFLDTLARLMTSKPWWRGRVKVEFIGHVQPTQQAVLDAFPIPDVVRSVGLLSQADARARLAAADVLLVFNTPEWHRYLQGKFLEYLAVPRPVLLYGEGGEMEALVRRARSGQAVRTNDPDELANALEALAQWAESDHPARLQAVHDLRRDVIAERYFALLDRVQASGAT